MKYLQKAVMPAREREWLAYGEEAVYGYVVQAEHAVWADTPEKLFRVHGLGFPGSPLGAELSFLDVIRIPVTPFVRVEAAVGGTTSQEALLTGGAFVDHPPFTGNGFVGGVPEHIVPLWWLDPIRIPAGAELWRVFADAHEERIATYGHVASGWVAEGEYALKRAAWMPPSEVNGVFGTWRGVRVLADPLPNGSVVVASAGELPGLRLTERGIWAGVVDKAEVNSLVGLRFTCVWRGLRFQIVRRLLGENGTLQARLVYLGRNAFSAEAAGLQKTDAGAYEATAAWSELGEVQGIELTPVA